MQILLLLQRSLRNFIFSLNCISETSLQLYQETFPILATLYLLKIYHIDFIVSNYRISPVSYTPERNSNIEISCSLLYGIAK